MQQKLCKILLVGSHSEKSNELIPLLKSHNFIVDYADRYEVALQKISNEETNLVISGQKLNGYHGFEVYNKLRGSLISAGVPYFMILEKFERDDILIGLEMGIDNFLIAPFNESVVINAIENGLQKKRDFNLYSSDSFKNYFLASPVAMFFKSNGLITLCNNAFCRTLGMCKQLITGMSVTDLFDLEGTAANKTSYRRFTSGVEHKCHLQTVDCHKKTGVYFDISFSRCKTDGVNSVFAEMVQSNNPSVFTGKTAIALTGSANEPKLVNTNSIKLTEREKQIYMLSAQGMALKQIAGELGLSQRTVEKHRANIMHKTKTRNFIETIAKISPGFSNLN